MNPRIFVFLGPSLSRQRAQEILPDAVYFPPIKCGDVLRCLRLRPEVILIIDGVFERTAAVWHKEILFAMEQGVTVMGAASMGALRAAELNCYGMQGVGDIYHHYASGKWQDDDEVAVLHGDISTDYQAITDPMANIRATVASAYGQGIIDDQALQSLITLAKNTFYPQRILIDLCLQVSAESSQAQMNRLVAWITKGGYIDQKALDAIALLHQVKQIDEITAATLPIKTPRSIYFRTLHRSILCQPFITYKNELPIQEKAALAARLFGKNYILLQRLSYLLPMVYCLAKKKVLRVNKTIYGLDSLVLNPQWQTNNDCLGTELTAFISRLQYISTYLQTHLLPMPETYLIQLMQLSGDYMAYKAEIAVSEDPRKNEKAILSVFERQDPEKYQLMYYIADIFRVIDYEAQQVGVTPQPMELIHCAAKFRMNRKLNHNQAMENWLANNDLSMDEFKALMACSLRFDFLVLGNNVDVIGGFTDHEEAWWFLDALWLSNLYGKAKRLYVDAAERHTFLKQWHGVYTPSEYAYKHDFSQGSHELTQFMASLSEQA